MSRQLTRLFRAALRYARATTTDLATEADYSRVTFELYANRRAPSVEAALALADALEERADRLAEYAAKLREAAGDGDASNRSRR